MTIQATDGSGHRIQFKGILTEADIDALASDSRVQTLQFSQPVDPAVWPRLEKRLFQRRPDIALRVFGHHGIPCDLSFLRMLPSLQRLYADCLQTALSTDAIGDLAALRELALGIHDLPNFDFLRRTTDGLETLILGQTKRQSISLDILPRFHRLRELRICGHSKQLDQVASLPLLEKLWLTSMRSPDLGFLSSIPGLWWLSVLLGGSEDLSAIAGARRLKYLELSWIRRLSKVDFIAGMTTLRHLALDKLIQVKELPSLRLLGSLRVLSLETMKGLQSVAPIAHAPALEWVRFIDASNFMPEECEVALAAPSLKGIWIRFGSDKKNAAFESMVTKRGLQSDFTIPSGLYA